ncbi:MAG: alpha/beta hydrolase [Parvularculaceae bacterium]|nr:alpha/beta hydrolase [Parvularculaceae bacterium]
MLSRLAARLDTSGAAKKLNTFREGWPSRSRPDIRFFDSGVTQYRYRERGSGPVIVFAADPPVTLEMYDELLDAFATRFRTIVVELPAMGFSAARASYGFGFEESADDIARFLRAVAGDGAILAFSCAAGMAAVDIAVRYPALVSALTLIQSTDWEGFQRWKAARDPKNILGKPFLGQIAMRKMGPKRAPDWFRLATGNKAMIEPFCQCAAETMAQGAGWPLASAYQRFLRAGSSPLGKPTQPVLILWGKADRSHGADAPERARTLGQNVRVVEVDHVGHFGDLEDTPLAFQIITEWLEALQPAAVAMTRA